MAITSGILGRHRGQCHAFFKGKHYIGDYKLSKVYEQSINYYTENTLPVYRMRQCPHIALNLYRVFYKLLELDLQFGVGDDPTVNPIVSLQISNDGGKTWGTELQSHLGTSGQFYARARWHQLGSSRDRIFRVIITAPVQVAMLSAFMDIEKGNN